MIVAIKNYKKEIEFVVNTDHIVSIEDCDIRYKGKLMNSKIIPRAIGQYSYELLSELSLEDIYLQIKHQETL